MAASKTLFALTLCLASSCQTQQDAPKASSSAADLEASAKVPAQFFGALARRDCKTMMAIAGGGLARKIEELGCDKTLTLMLEEHPMRFREVVRTEVDGRDPRAFIVTCALEVDGKPQQSQLRVVRDGDRLRLVSM